MYLLKTHKSQLGTWITDLDLRTWRTIHKSNFKHRKPNFPNVFGFFSWENPWLVVWNMNFICSPIFVGMMLSNLTNSYLFQKGLKPPTRSRKFTIHGDMFHGVWFSSGGHVQCAPGAQSLRASTAASGAEWPEWPEWPGQGGYDLPGQLKH